MVQTALPMMANIIQKKIDLLNPQGKSGHSRPQVLMSDCYAKPTSIDLISKWCPMPGNRRLPGDSAATDWRE